jgi:hypothetical protein
MGNKTLVAVCRSSRTAGGVIAAGSSERAARLCASGAYDILPGIGKSIPGKFKHGVFEGDKYCTPKGMTRSGVR